MFYDEQNIFISHHVIFKSIFSKATSLSLGEQTGDDFVYDEEKEYVQLDILDLKLPKIDDNNQNKVLKLINLFSHFVLDRKKFGTAFIEVKPAFGEALKTILFSYEIDDNKRYSFSYVGSSESISFPISKAFIFNDIIDINITIKEWENEESSALIKRILSTPDSGNSSLSYTEKLASYSSVLELIERVFPADNVEHAMSLRINKNDISKKNIEILSDNANFFKINLRSVKPYFENFDIDKGIQKAGIETFEPWMEVIKNADKNLDSDGKEPLLAITQSFSDYVLSLPLNHFDQAMFTACAISQWANDAVRGRIYNENEHVQFTAHDYSRLPSSDLTIARNTDCDFSGVNCKSDNCLAMSDFINKSATSRSREIASNLYIDGEITVSLSNSEIVLDSEKFKNSFRISRSAYFDSEPTGIKSWSYLFKKGTLDLRIDGIKYIKNKIRIDLVEDDSGEERRFIITGIEIDDLNDIENEQSLLTSNGTE